MIMLDDVTALVMNSDDLHDAVSTDNGVELVYFGADFTLAYGITIFPGKQSLTFNGTYQGIRHTFTDMPNTGSGNTIGVRGSSNITITFKDINLIGRNFYGIPYIISNPSCNNISTIYENVTYEGVQITYNPYGFTRYVDCNITVNLEEVAETSRIEIGGNTNLIKTNDDDAVFWFRSGGSQSPYLRILSGANVTITTSHYFMYENSPPDFIIEPGASLILNTNSGISWSSAHTVASFSVGENASFWYKQNVNIRNVDTLYLDGPLTVMNGATFYMQADFDNSQQLINFTGSSAGLYIDNPKSFALYNRGSGLPAAIQFAATIPIVLSGGQVNYWDSAKTFPDAGTFEDVPARKWNRPGYGRFTLRGTASNSATNITSNDFTPEELADLWPLTDLKLQSAKVLSVGQILLEIHSAVLTRGVTGATEADASVKLMLIPSYYEDPHTVVADDTGAFVIIPTPPIQYSNAVVVFSNTPFLIVSAGADTYAENELLIVSAPEQISFPVKPMQGFEDIILARDSDNLFSPVEILDTRADDLEWQLWLNISGPLKTDEDDILTDGVIYRYDNGVMETLQTGFIPVRTGRNSGVDKVTITWPEDRGVLVRITVPIRTGKRYTTNLNWAITPMGDLPEGME